VNGDGRLDLVVNITTSKTGLGLTDTLAKVSGLTNSGLQILGSSSPRTGADASITVAIQNK